MAMELAMLVMVVTFALSILLTTLALMQANRKNIELRDVKEKIALEQIGEDYLLAVKNNGIAEFSLDEQSDYVIDTKTEHSLVVRKKSNNEVALTVELNGTQVTVWKID